MDLRQSPYWDIWGKAWNFHKQYCEVKTDDSYWENVVNAAGELYKEYEGKPEGEFMKALVLAIVDELERVGKNERNKEK